MFLAVLPACPQWLPLYNWLPNDPQFSGFFTPMTLLLLHLVRNGLVLTRVAYWMTPYFGEYTFYLIGPYFWLGVGTYLSLQIGSASPPPQEKNRQKVIKCNTLFYQMPDFCEIAILTPHIIPSLLGMFGWYSIWINDLQKHVTDFVYIFKNVLSVWKMGVYWLGLHTKLHAQTACLSMQFRM